MVLPRFAQGSQGSSAVAGLGSEGLSGGGPRQRPHGPHGKVLSEPPFSAHCVLDVGEMMSAMPSIGPDVLCKFRRPRFGMNKFTVQIFGYEAT